MNALVILIACLLFVAALALWFNTRKKLDDFSNQIQQQLYSEQVIDQISAVNAGSIGMGGRFLKLEKEMQMLIARIDDLQTQIQSHTPYAHAITLAQKGSSVEEIMELCGISQNEAELLLMMHRNSKAA